MHCERSYRSPTRFLLFFLVLLALTAGCDDAAKKQPGAKGSASVAKPTAPVAAKQLIDLKAPANVIAFGGVDNLQQILGKAQGVSGGLVPPEAVSPAVVAAGLQGMLKLTSADAIDLAKPARFMVVDPKKHPEPLTIVIGTKGKDKLIAALPADKKKDDGGNAFSWKAEGNKTAYLSFIGDAAVISSDPGGFAAHKAFLTELVHTKLPGGIAVVGSVVNMVTLYGTEIDQGLQQVKEGLKQIAKSGPAGPAGPAGLKAGQVEGFNAMLDWAGATVKDLEKVVIETKLSADGGLLSFQLHPKKGTEVEKIFKMLGKRPLTLLSKLPANSSAFFDGNLDPDGASELTRRLVTWSLTMGIGGAEVPEKYITGMSDYWKATTGEFVVAVHPAVDGKGLALTGLMGLRDAEKARSMIKLLAEMYQDPIIAKGYKELGLTMDFKPEAYKIGDVTVATMQVKMAQPMAELGPLGPMIQDLLTTHTGTGKDMGYIAYGKDGKATLEALIGGKLGSGLDKAPATVRALKHAAPNAFFLMCGAPLDIAKGIDLGGKNPLVAKLADAPTSKTGLCFSAGQKDGVIHLTTDVPGEQAKAIAQLVALVQQL